MGQGCSTPEDSYVDNHRGATSATQRTRRAHRANRAHCAPVSRTARGVIPFRDKFTAAIDIFEGPCEHGTIESTAHSPQSSHSKQSHGALLCSQGHSCPHSPLLDDCDRCLSLSFKKPGGGEDGRLSPGLIAPLAKAAIRNSRRASSSAICSAPSGW